MNIVFMTGIFFTIIFIIIIIIIIIIYYYYSCCDFGRRVYSLSSTRQNYSYIPATLLQYSLHLISFQHSTKEREREKKREKIYP